ncbi:MAG: hypothetical protein V4629_02210 [Pseudomonadota bacterium]
MVLSFLTSSNRVHFTSTTSPKNRVSSLFSRLSCCRSIDVVLKSSSNIEEDRSLNLPNSSNHLESIVPASNTLESLNPELPGSELSKRLDSIVFKALQAYKNCEMDFKTTTRTLEKLWFEGARGKLKILNLSTNTEQSLPEWLASNNFSPDERKEIQNIIYQSRNPTAEKGVQKSKFQHGSNWLINNGLRGGLHAPKGGYQSKEGMVFIASLKDKGPSYFVSPYKHAAKYAFNYSPLSINHPINLIDLMEKLEKSYQGGAQKILENVIIKDLNDATYVRVKLDENPEVRKVQIEEIKNLIFEAGFDENEAILTGKDENLIGNLSKKKELALGELCNRFLWDGFRVLNLPSLTGAPEIKFILPRSYFSIKLIEFGNKSTDQLGFFKIPEYIIEKFKNVLLNNIEYLLNPIYLKELSLTSVLSYQCVPIVLGFDEVDLTNDHVIQSEFKYQKLHYREEPLPFEGNLKSISFQSKSDWSTYWLGSRLKKESFPTVESVMIKTNHKSKTSIEDNKRIYFNKEEVATVHDTFESFKSDWIAKNFHGNIFESFDPIIPEQLAAARHFTKDLREFALASIENPDRNVFAHDKVSAEAFAPNAWLQEQIKLNGLKSSIESTINPNTYESMRKSSSEIGHVV